MLYQYKKTYTNEENGGIMMIQYNTDELYDYIAMRARELRISRGYTKTDVAKRLGKSFAFVYQLETRRCNCKIETLFMIMNIYQISWSEFFKEEIELTPEQKQFILLVKALPKDKFANLMTEVQNLTNYYNQ